MAGSNRADVGIARVDFGNVGRGVGTRIHDARSVRLFGSDQRCTVRHAAVSDVGPSSTASTRLPRTAGHDRV